MCAPPGIKVCCGGIVGLGESRAHRAGLLAQLANLDPAPESVPINNLVRVPGTPLADAEPVDPFELVRVIAAARITMPHARIRLSARAARTRRRHPGRCAFWPARIPSSTATRLLVTGNTDAEADRQLLARLDLPLTSEISS